MATFTDNFALVKPTYGELADVAVINGNMDTIDGIMHSNRTMLAPAFSQTEGYAVGDVVVYEGNLYRFIVPHTAGNWDGTEVEQTTLGEEVATKGGADVTKTASGNPITFDDGASAPLFKCVTQITGSQDLHGYDKPWVGGAGKNKLGLPYKGTSQTSGGITVTVNDDGTVRFVGEASGDFYWTFKNNDEPLTLPAGTYTWSSSNSIPAYVAIYYGNTFLNGGNLSRVITYSETDTYSIYIQIPASAGYVDFTVKMQIESGSSATAWTPYSNICPITAYTEGEIEVSDGDGNTTTHTTTYPSAIYRGSEDVVKGTETHDIVKVVFDGSSDEDWGLSVASAANNCFSIKIYDADRTMNAYHQVMSNMFESPSTLPSADNRQNKIFMEVFTAGLSYTFINVGASDEIGQTVSDFKTYLSTHNLEVVYELATPTTSSVTPTNLPIKSLSGYNHIESTTGDMEIEYITEEFQPIVDLIESNKHVYSTAEQIVGTWIDGSVVYEKTYDIGYLTSNNKTIAHGISGFGHIIQIHGYVTNDTYNFNLPHVTTDAVSCVGVHVDSTNIYITSYDRSDYHGYVIIRYTKTTPTRSLNLTKSAVTEIPDEIKNAEYEEKPDYNEADDDAPTEVDER